MTNAPILQYTPDVANTGGGNAEIDHIRFEGNSSTPVVYLKSIYAQSSFHHNTIYQAGTGNGFQSELSNGIEIHNNYAINRDWNTNGLGAARVGIGFYIFQTIPTGLTTLRKNTSRGFLTAYRSRRFISKHPIFDKNRGLRVFDCLQRNLAYIVGQKPSCRCVLPRRRRRRNGAFLTRAATARSAIISFSQASAPALTAWATLTGIFISAIRSQRVRLPTLNCSR